MTRPLLVAVAAATLAGCDGLTDPGRTNVYDPEREGGRVTLAPDGLHVVGTTDSTLVLSWTDRSSFEAGYRVYVAYEPPRERERNWGTVAAEVPADAETAEIDVRDDRTRWVRVVGVGGPDDRPEGDVSGPLVVSLSVPSRFVGMGTFGNSEVALAPWARRVYAKTYEPGSDRAARAYDAETGQELWAYDGGGSVLGPTSEGGVVLGPAASDERAGFLHRLSPDGAVTLVALEGSRCGEYGMDLVLGAGGAEVAAECSADRKVRVWDATTGRAVGAVPYGEGGGGRLLGLGPDGAVYLVSPPHVVRVDAATGVARWVRDFGISDTPGAGPHLVASPDGRWVYLALRSSAAGTIRLLDASTGQDVAEPREGWGGSAAFSADGRLLTHEASYPSQRAGTPPLPGVTAGPIASGVTLARASDFGMIRAYAGRHGLLGVTEEGVVLVDFARGGVEHFARRGAWVLRQ